MNADGLIDNRGLNTQNLYAYCGNNPISLYDPDGMCRKFLGILWKIDCKSEKCEKSRYYDPNLPEEPSGTYNGGKDNIYVVTADQASKLTRLTKYNNVVIVDKRKDHSNPNMQILSSYRINNASHQREIVEFMIQYDKDNPSSVNWGRSEESLLEEWRIHNIGYRFGILPSRTGDCDFDYLDEGKGLLDFIFGDSND